MKKWEDSSWQNCYEICFALHILKAEISAMVGEFERAEKIFPILLQYAKTNTDKCNAYLVMYYFYEIQVRREEREKGEEREMKY
jgi:NMD protein affecting ribosome stability and mRNA decay